MNGHTTGSNDAFDAIDYSTQSFEWSEDLKRKMKQVWDISEFRMCQRGVCNAVMDGRDVVCIMPTGGGKSLTYQLPALMTPGCTVVISPLISLMTDQTLHLQEVNIRAVMLSGTTSQAETREVYDRLLQRYDERDGSERIKLLYVTPEKIVKNKKLTSVLEKMAHAGSLDRIVIDEAHCVSQLGHDYRPDYAKLTSLRKMLPSVPILAVSATCPPRVLVDVLKILGLDRLTNGNAANGTGTVHFSAPLFRPNLLYQVVVKGSSGHRVIQDIANYILTRHKLDSGIVYCLTKSDAEDTASGLAKASGGIIKTGVYHSACDQRDKERLHQRWRAGEVKVICATIAFGLGIDKGDVRFVLHRSLAKTLDGFYQESGRAGRDGKNADCVLFYQPQDTWTLCSMAFQEVDGVLKLKAMLRFAQNFRDCRKKIFSKYFYEASAISSVSWSAEETPQDCKVCDNCQRPPGTTVNEAITLPAWQIFRAVAYVTDRGDQVTMKQICDLVRKKRGASDANSATGTKRRKSAVDMTVIAGGTINWPQEKLEVLIIHLWLEGYLEERFVPTECM
ncbi:ATP-dependent DNA helicase [Sistotremastrum suecicum HHB10207 ss-3]|uniref:ATP-dependent DNA helicase n=1 Tax=Sistotremastrum suecicum HHB10207 ss-3 TaxID=1314776 RepID=A0A166BKQ3_9AGAM|nr:ATP-dependent DNA helicase [Sistotremastrum suecicum HHB10207 ss-3]